MSRIESGYYTGHDTIAIGTTEAKARKFVKSHKFPANENWKYQIALDITYVNNKGREVRWGNSLGATAGVKKPAVSYRDKKFDFDSMLKDAYESGFNYCAGDQYGTGQDTNRYAKDQYKKWSILKLHNISVVVWRRLKDPYETANKPPRAALKAPVFALKVKPLTQAEREKKYAPPKKYVAAMKKLHKENIAKESRRLKREKQRALKRKK